MTDARLTMLGVAVGLFLPLVTGACSDVPCVPSQGTSSSRELYLIPSVSELGPDGGQVLFTALVMDESGCPVPETRIAFDTTSGTLLDQRVQTTNELGLVQISLETTEDMMLCATMLGKLDGGAQPPCLYSPPPLERRQRTAYDCTTSPADAGSTSDGSVQRGQAGFASSIVHLRKPVICEAWPQVVSWQPGTAVSVVLSGIGFGTSPNVLIGNERPLVLHATPHSLEVLLIQPDRTPVGGQPVIVSNSRTGYTYRWENPGLFYVR